MITTQINANISLTLLITLLMSFVTPKNCLIKPTLILVTHAPSHPLATLALRFATTYLMETDKHNDDLKNNHGLSVFFYGDGAITANCLSWQPDDQINVTKDWQRLASDYQLELPVCVSTALARGITDTENSKRHGLSGNNLADKFSLVGLSTVVMAMQQSKVIHF